MLDNLIEFTKTFHISFVILFVLSSYNVHLPSGSVRKILFYVAYEHLNCFLY